MWNSLSNFTIDLIKSSYQHTVGDTLWYNFELVGCHLLTKLNGSSTPGVELNGNSTLGLGGTLWENVELVGYHMFW